MAVSIVGQFNLQKHFGGGEVFTQFLCYALDELGIQTILFIDSNASFWSKLDLPESTKILPVSGKHLSSNFFKDLQWIIGHGPLPKSLLSLNRNLIFTAIAHMPVQGRDPWVYLGHDMVFPVSKWVMQGLRLDVCPIWNDPLYGISDLELRSNKLTKIIKNSSYDWDERKIRDKILKILEKPFRPLLPKNKFVKRFGITIGIVSRITPIKQFPDLFKIISPVIKKYPLINIEIFGSGGYASIRDLKKSLSPIKKQVRFWGHQNNVQLVYKQLDFVLSGLPEKEALGLNLIEAQSLNVPVLAINSPPFTETVVDKKTGYLFIDPRDDKAKDFSLVLELITSTKEKLNPLQYYKHLEKFTHSSLVGRLRYIIRWVNKQKIQ